MMQWCYNCQAPTSHIAIDVATCKCGLCGNTFWYKVGIRGIPIWPKGIAPESPWGEENNYE